MRVPLLPRLAAGDPPLLGPLLRLCALGLAQAVLAVAAARITRAGFDELFAAPAAPQLRSLLAALALLALASAGLRHLETMTAERLGHGWAHHARLALFAHLLSLAPDARLPCGEGALLLRFAGDLTALRRWLARGLARLVASGIAVLATLAALLLLAPTLALLLAVALLLLALLALGLARDLQRGAAEMRRLRGRLAQRIAERLRARRTIAAFAREGRERTRIARASARLGARILARAAAVARLRALAEAGSYAVPALVLGCGALLASRAALTPGTLITALLLAGLFAPRIRELARVLEHASAAAVARGRFEALLAAGSPRRRGRRRLPGGGGAIALRRLSCRGRLARLDLDIAAGARVAVTGPSGAGKTTLLLLLAGVLTPDGGEIRIDGAELARLRPSARRRAVAFAGEAVPLFGRRLEEMLLYGRDRPGRAELVALLRALGFAAWAEEIAAGRALRLAPQALSAGERARLLLARALLAEPRVLLLDEIEAALDADNRRRVAALIAAFPGTVLVAGHHPEALLGRGRLLRLEQGRLVEDRPFAREPRLEVVG